MRGPASGFEFRISSGVEIDGLALSNDQMQVAVVRKIVFDDFLVFMFEDSLLDR